MPSFLPNKSLTLPSGTTYSYVYHPASDPNKPTLLFCHGFPSTTHDWRFQLAYFSSLGYGVLAPDMLGYGKTSKPTDLSAYIGQKMAADIVGILDHEKIVGELVGIAHDWGVYALSSLVIYHGDRFTKLVFVSVAFMPPKVGKDGQTMDYETLLQVNAATEKMLGYPCFGYWFFFNEPDAGKTIGEHWESFYELLYAEDTDLWQKHLAPVGAAKTFITTDQHAKSASYFTPEDKAYFHSVFGADYSAPTCWYKRSLAGLGVEEERKAIEAGEVKTWKVDSKLDKETLLVTGTRDAVCIPEIGRQSMRKFTEEGKLRIVDLEAGHWVQLEKATEFNQALLNFIQGAGDGETKL
ncbi:hypothetical protein BP5796_06256 [Coleophoma crateriformis]|uniref:AB hydrolase-1 domain-containing protein n=1 Tax=Coleophoma crateriformis TaxID=565419 RepID=A0A3D8RX43_9HELO|nr:hypothetical protein BP5796_06256 [Coleophoma crateriformis]